MEEGISAVVVSGAGLLNAEGTVTGFEGRLSIVEEPAPSSEDGGATGVAIVAGKAGAAIAAAIAASVQTNGSLRRELLMSLDKPSLSQ
jgi:hypothetical protein